MVEISNLTKSYGGTKALSDVSFRLSEGKIYGLLGPNGAGKSTTMNIMTGYIGASEGSVTIDGLDIYKDAKRAKAKIGYLPEIPPLYPDMTVHEYLMFVCELKGIPKKDRLLTVEEIMDETGTTDVADRLIKNLSKGYRQRVGFAQAVIGNPELIILDEPTVGLDPRQILEFRNLIREYGKEHIVMISSHILSEIKEVCGHVFIISHGNLVADIDMDEVGDSLEEKFFELTDAEPEEEPAAAEGAENADADAENTGGDPAEGAENADADAGNAGGDPAEGAENADADTENNNADMQKTEGADIAEAAEADGTKEPSAGEPGNIKTDEAAEQGGDLK